MKGGSIVLLVLAVSLGLSACGRKNPPKVPPDYHPKPGQTEQTPPDWDKLQVPKHKRDLLNQGSQPSGDRS